MTKTLLAMLRDRGVTGTGEKFSFQFKDRRLTLRRDAFGSPERLQRALTKQGITGDDLAALLGNKEEAQSACEFVLALSAGRVLTPRVAAA
ncbi:MAG: hypothetical protein HYV42_01375 [Candidatus Magasanikbacteria bacterium]|nr:hypothetical protein [Candidatus Magasanikbacteria bacterium]